MSRPAPPPPDDTAALAAPFPFHLVIDAALRLQRIGHGLRRFDPGLQAGAAFSEHFVVLQPPGVADWGQLAAAANRPCVIAHRRTGLELRGQLLVPEAAGPAIFLGSSWLDDPAQLAEFGAVAGDDAAAGGASPPDYRGSGTAIALQLAVAHGLAGAASTADALARLVDTLPAALGWPAALFWRLGNDGRLQPERQAPERFAASDAARALAARALARGAPLADASGFALPVLSGFGTLGVISVCAAADADADVAGLLPALAVVGGQLAQFVARQAVGERLRRLTSELAAIFQLSPDGFVAFAEDGRLNYINPALLRLTGFSRDELEGSDEAGFAARLAAIADPARPSQPVAEDEAIVHLLRPRPRVLRQARREARDPDGRLFGRILYFRDITQETEVDRMKNEFLSTAAHELRTPLASIHGFTELLLQQEFAAGQRQEILATILGQTTRLVDMVNGLLDLARIEAGAGEDFVRVDQPLLPVIETTLAGLRVPDDPRRVDFRPAPGDSGLSVTIDRDKFVRALTNVLSNAYKYSPRGGAITLTLRRAAGRVGVAVRDRGIGMTAEQQARVFDRFFRADPSGAIPGTGLGMSLVKQIIEHHDGSVELESAPGRGTEVTLWLPLAQAPAARQPPRRRRQPRAGST